MKKQPLSVTITETLQSKLKNSDIDVGFGNGYLYIHYERRGLMDNSSIWPSMYKEFDNWQDFLDWLDSNG